MFDRFGEFNSAEEINTLASDLKDKGDNDSIYALSEENGIDRDIAEMFIGGELPYLCDGMTAAIGKLDIEAKDLKTEGILADWVDHIKTMCMQDADIAGNVRKKGKKLKECMAALIRFSFENKVQVSTQIVSITKVTHNGKEEQMRAPLYMGIPNKMQVKKIAGEYYRK